MAGLAQYARALKIGDPTAMDTMVGPVISKVQQARIEGYIASGESDGADLVVDGRGPAGLDTGCYVGPTLLANCRPEMRAVQEEIFGPVVVAVPFDDEEEAIAIANSTDFGLYDYVFTTDSEKAYRVAGRLRSGNVGINTAQRNHETPFGGFKMSGIGRRRRRLRSPRLHRDADRGVARMSAGFLSGLRVLECSLLGPAAITSHFVDFGAEVIKIEAPGGDYVRRMTWPIVEGTSLLHLHVNRGKKSLTLDLKKPEAIAIFEDLVRTSDVVVEAMRPGFLDKRGFTFERLTELNPKIVVCSISGYGATGPYRDLPSHGIAYDTWSGGVKPTVDEQGFTRLPDQVNIGITAGPAFGALGHPRCGHPGS